MSLPRYTHDPLAQPDSQIRLLRIGRDERAPPQIWASLSIHNLASQPRYAAISYTWGSDETTRTVDIDGCELPITDNCMLVLQQIELQRDFEYFWIDSICIDQLNIPEKEVQVSIMADIYSGAACTLVGLGSHDVSSRLMFLATAARVAWQQASDPGPEEQWFSLQDDQTSRRILAANGKFRKRPYWNRLWVYQELARSRAIKLMCDTDVLPWEHLADLLQEMQNCFHTWGYGENLQGKRLDCVHNHDELQCDWLTALNPMSGWQDRRAIELSLPRLKYGGLAADPVTSLLFGHGIDEDASDLYNLLQATSGRQCRDCLDRIYGVRSLVHWPAGISQVDVKYSIEPYHLAEKALLHYPLASPEKTLAFVNIVRRALGLSSETPTVAALLAERTMPQRVESCIEDTAQSVFTVSSLYSCIIEVASDGKATAPLLWDIRKRDSSMQISSLTSHIDRECSPPDRRSRPLYVGCSSQIGGLLPGNTQAGDVLAQVEGGLHLVLRPVKHNQFAILGQAVLEIESKICDGRVLCKNRADDPVPRQCDHGTPMVIRLRFSAGDLLLLLCQPRIHDVAYDPGRLAVRVATAVTDGSASSWAEGVERTAV